LAIAAAKGLHMKRLLLGALTTVALSATVFAADLPARTYTKGPTVVMDPAYNWTGFYVGADVGGAWGPDVSETTVDTNPFGFSPNTFGRHSGSGVIGGIYGGYNWQWNSPLVLGIEADVSATSVKTSDLLTPALAGAGLPAPGAPAVPVAGSSWTASTEVKWLASVRGRAGYAADRVLLYVTGGAAWINMDYNASLAGLNAVERATASFNTTKTGWVAGAGIEWAFMTNWLVRAEYLYYGFDGATATASFLPAPCNGCGLPVNYRWSSGDVQSARVGVAYKFGGPVVARY
jgi:outer membrane immunogenic protein